MAPREEAVTAIVIDGSGAKRGADEVVAAADRIKLAGGEIDATNKRILKSSLDTERSIQKLTDRYDPMAKAQRALARDMSIADNALIRGATTIEKHTELVSKINQEYRRQVDAAGAAAAAQRNYAIATERARQAAETAQLAFARQLNINPGSGAGSARASAAVFEEQARAQEDAARSAAQLATQNDALRRKYSPLYAAQSAYLAQLREIKAAGTAGVLSQQEQAAAIANTKTVFVEQVQGMRAGAATMASGWKLNHQGLMQLQASGVNTFQALASGMSVTTVATTQSAQVLGALVQGGLLSMKTLLGVGGAVIGVAAAVGTFIYAFASGVLEMKEFERVSRITANAAGLTAGALMSISVAAADSGNIGIGTARALATEMAATGKIGVEVIGKLTAITADYAEATGQSAEEAGKALTASFTDPLKGAEQLDNAYNFLTAAQLHHIRTLTEQGQRTQAQIVLADALNDRIKHLADDGLTMLGRGLRAAKGWWDEFWDAAKGLGREDSVEERLAKARASLAENTGGGRVGPAFTNDQTLANLRREIAALEIQKSGLDALASAAAANARFNEQAKALVDVTRGYESYSTKQEELRNLSIRFADAIDQVNQRISALGENPSGRAGLNALTALLAQLKIGARDAAAELTALRKPLDASTSQTSIAREVAGLSPSARGPRQAYLTELDRAGHGTADEQANKLALATEAATRAVIAQNTAIADQNALFIINAIESAKVADAYLVSAAAGKTAEAQRQAAQEAFQTGVDAEVRARQILSGQIDQSVIAGSQQTDELKREAAQRQALAAAALQGASVQREAETAAKISQATLAERTALLGASADQEQRLQLIIRQKTEAITNEAAAVRDLAAAESLQQQADQVTLLEAQLRLITATNEQRVVELARVQALIDLHKKEGDALTANEQRYVEQAERVAKLGIEHKFLQDSYGALADAGVQAFDRIGEAITQGLATGESMMVKLGNIWRAVVSEMIQTAAKLAVINPIINSVFGQARPTLGGAVSAASGAGGGGFGGTDLLSGASSLYNIATGGPASLATSFATSGLGVSLGLSQGTAFAAGVAPVVGGATNAAVAGTAGLSTLTGAGSALVAAAPYIAAAVALFALIGPSLFGGKPSVGPVGIADFSPGLGRKRAFDVDGIDPFTADNGGNGESLRPIAEAIADLIADSADRFSATIDQSLRFRVANYEGPESGSGRSAGFEVNGFIRGEAEKRVAEGLSQEQAVFEALKFAISEAFTFESATLQEIAASTAATTTEGLLADLQFGEDFDALSAAIADLGGVVNANTLATAQQTVAIQKQAEEFAAGAVKSILDPLTKAVELFKPIEGTGNSTADAFTAQAEAIRNVVLDFDRGAVRGGTLGFDYGREGDSEFIRSGEDRFNIARVVSDNAEGTAFALQNGEGESVAQFDSMSALLSGAGAALADYNEQLAAQSDSLGRTAEEQARYDANLERIRTSTELAVAGFDLLGQQITGTFDPTVIGPYQNDLEITQARIEALRPHYESMNEQIREANLAFPELNQALIDVDATIAQLTADALTVRQGRFNDDIQAQTNAATGLGGLNSIDALVKARDANYSDAEALGIPLPSDGPNNISRLFDAQLRQSLNGASLADLNNMLNSGQIVDAGARAVVELVLQETALAEVRAQELAGLQKLSGETERFAAAANDNARALRHAASGLLVNRDLSPLSPLQRLEEARRQFEDAVTLANDADPTDKESQDAITRLPGLSDTLLQASRDYFASSAGYLEDFNRVQEALGSTALRQESIEQQQLNALKDIEAAILGAGGSGDAAERAAASGYNFGTNVGLNKQIYNSLVAAGLPTPTAFGSGGLNALRAANPAVDALLRAKGLADGDLITGGVPGRDSVPAWLMPGERVFSVPHSRMLEQLASNQNRGDGLFSGDVLVELRSFRRELSMLREVVADSGNITAEATRGVARTIDRGQRDQRQRSRHGAAA